MWWMPRFATRIPVAYAGCFATSHRQFDQNTVLLPIETLRTQLSYADVRSPLAGRVLDANAKVSEEVDAIIVDCGDARFGSVRLTLDRPEIWVDAINRL